ncbi:MAG: hypothetical protein KJ645_03085, partial [Planctomycetes bacterium]|nr:hypothetical protein [Planctomycetota bacterium]
LGSVENHGKGYMGNSFDPLLYFKDSDPLSPVKRQRLSMNATNLARDLLNQRSVFQSMPLLLEFSTNNKCNLRCIICSPKGRRARKLDPDLVQNVLVDQLLPNALSLLPSSGSEPFLGDLELLGQGSVKHEIQLNIITNGTLMKKQRLTAIERTIGRLQVSMDGHRKDLYESIRVGAQF